jgi:hypothetical protein
MATIPAGAILQVEVVGGMVDAGAVDNVFHCRVGGFQGSPWEAAIIALDIQTWLGNIWAKVVNSITGGSTWEYFNLKQLTNGLGAPLDPPVDHGSWYLGLHGNDAGEPLPSGVSALMTAPTGVPKRRGRKFLPPFGETYSNLQKWTATALTRLTEAALQWALGFAGGNNETIVPVVWSVVHQLWSFFSSTRSNATPAYQRRRKPGVGA